MVVFGCVLLAVGVVLFFTQRSQKQTLRSIQSARPVTVAELTELADAVAQEIGGGSWRDYVKLWGEIVVEAPLYSEHRQEPCVYFTSKVTREYESTRTVTSKKGTSKVEQVRKSEVVSQTKRSIPFWLRDRTGQIQVQPEDAAIDTISVMDEFRPQPEGKTLGYRYRESILPASRNVLVIGAVSDSTGEIMIGKPQKPSHRYLISLKDEAALQTKTQRNAKVGFYGMLGCLGLGSLLLIMGILS